MNFINFAVVDEGGGGHAYPLKVDNWPFFLSLGPFPNKHKKRK